MKVTQVAVCPSAASQAAGRPALTPELLAASGARYSRNNEGLDSILARIDPNDLEKSVDTIFKMVDYGHQSIADMVPVAIFMDGVSIWLAYYLWTLCPLAGGQESSTRYLRLSREGLIAPDVLGIPVARVAEWSGVMEECFVTYQAVLEAWEGIARRDPRVMGIPASLVDDPSPAGQKKVARLRRNFAFDRARYFLPAAAATNVMMVMSARAWVGLCQYLLSHPLPEPRRLGEMVRAELAFAAPRLLRHATASAAHQRAIAAEFEAAGALARTRPPFDPASAADIEHPATPSLSVFPAEGTTPAVVAQDLGFHPHRYAPVGASLQRMAVRFGWSAVGFAEIRDLNRHRTGTKYCPWVPVGFYGALDQARLVGDPGVIALLEEKLMFGGVVSAAGGLQIEEGDPAHVYWALLGTQYPFEHLTTADKFLYEAELRTGVGAHYRYARHLREALGLWYEQFPATKGLVLEGGAEPE